MNIRKLEIFYKTATCLNMSKVAKDLYVSQPSISKCILELENELDTKLFDRIGKKLYLTKQGEIFYDYARRILNLYEEGIEKVVESSKNNKGKIIVGASTTIGIYIMPYIIQEFNKRMKDIEITIIIENKSLIEYLILENRIDIGFIEGDLTSEEFDVRPIWKDELVFISGKEHPWKDKKIITLEDLKGTKFISREHGSGTRLGFEKVLGNLNLEYDNNLELGNTEAIINFVKGNIGISCVSYFCVREKEKLGELNISRLRNYNIERNLHMVVHKDKYISSAMKSFISFCEDIDIYS